MPGGPGGAVGDWRIGGQPLFRIFGSALLLSVISAGFEIATNDDQIDENQQTAREAVARQMSQVGRVLEKNLNIQPTITILAWPDRFGHGQQGSVFASAGIPSSPAGH